MDFSCLIFIEDLDAFLKKVAHLSPGVGLKTSGAKEEAAQHPWDGKEGLAAWFTSKRWVAVENLSRCVVWIYVKCVKKYPVG